MKPFSSQKLFIEFYIHFFKDMEAMLNISHMLLTHTATKHVNFFRLNQLQCARKEPWVAMTRWKTGIRH